MYLPVCAQEIPDWHSFRAGDVIVKEQIAYKDPGRSGRDVLWDVSEQESVDRQYSISYASVDGYPGIISGTEHRTSYYYLQSGDTLWLSGFENRTTHSVYDRPEPLAVFPLEYGSHAEGLFHGRCASSDRLMMRQFGSYSMDVDATGMLLLPSGDTLRHVSRVHTKRIVGEHLFPSIHSEDELSLFTDSLSPYNADSIRHYLQTDSALVEIHIYRFYAAGYRYPVFETITTGMKDEPPLLTTAYYYSPSAQEALDDEENAELRRALSAADRHNTVNAPDDSGDAGSADNGHSLRFNYNYHSRGGTLTLEFFSGGSATVSCGVYTLSGIQVSGREESVGSGIHRWSFDLSGQQAGVYLLSLSVNGKKYTEKIYFRN